MSKACQKNYSLQASGLMGAVAVSVMVLVSGCSINKVSLTPYKAEVVQGNFVSREQVQALRPGMPKQTVRDILGTPLVTSVFHDNRWDYAFTIRRQGAEPLQRRFSVFFQGNQLVRVEGDQLPTEAEFAADIDVRKLPSEKPPLKATEEMLSQYPRPVTPVRVNEPSPDVQARKTYPPLESSSQ